MLVLPICDVTRFILVRPHYPENVGAAVRAIKTMGITRLSLVKPGRLATVDNEMTYKMAVKSWDVLEQVEEFATLSEALRGTDLVFSTTSRRGQRAVTVRSAASAAQQAAEKGSRIAVVFGNEKTGLSTDDLKQCMRALRIPMAADQPSINLAQACQIVAYEWFTKGLEARARDAQQHDTSRT